MEQEGIEERLIHAGERVAEACNEVIRVSVQLKVTVQPFVTAFAEGFERRVRNDKMFEIARKISRLRCKSAWQRLMDE